MGGYGGSGGPPGGAGSGGGDGGGGGVGGGGGGDEGGGGSFAPIVPGDCTRRNITHRCFRKPTIVRDAAQTRQSSTRVVAEGNFRL